jgi:hypothetical protein
MDHGRELPLAQPGSSGASSSTKLAVGTPIMAAMQVGLRGGVRASLHSCIISVLFLLTSRIMDYLYYIILFINTYYQPT